MRILAVASALPTAADPSKGAFYARLLEEFAEAGHKVVVVLPLRLGSRKSRVLLSADIAVLQPRYFPTGRIRFGAFDGRRSSIRSFAAAVCRAVEAVDTLPDVIFAHFFLPSGYAATEVSRRIGRPAFCSIGESRCSSWFSLLQHAEVVGRLRDFRCLFPVADHIAQYLHGHCGVSLSAIQTVYNGVDQSIFVPGNKISARAALGVDAGRKIALFVGSNEVRKGSQLLASAASFLPEEWEVWLLGSGHRRHKGANVRVLEAVEQRHLPLYYHAADVFVLPSEAEGMPNSLLEALACRVPIVASRIPPVIELLGENYPLYCAMTVADIADKVQRAERAGPTISGTVTDITARARTILERISADVQ